MTILSRGLAAAIALGLAGASILAVHAAKHDGWRNMSAESVARMQDGKIAAAKAALKFTPQQEALWAPVEAQVRAQYKARAEKRAAWEKRREERRAERAKESEAAAPGERPDMAERIERRAERLSARADRMRAFSAAFGPFYASLGEEQKAVLGPVMRDLRMIGGKRRGHGPRWARWGGQHGKSWHQGPRGDKGGPGGDPAGEEPRP